MIARDVGGANPVDTTAAYGLRITDPIGWYDSVEHESPIARIPDRPDGVELSGGMTLMVSRDLRLVGWMSRDTHALLMTAFRDLKATLKVDQPQVEVELEMPGDADIIHNTNVLHVEHGTIRPVFEQRAMEVTIRTVGKDPRKFDISGGRPGTAVP